jgi:hypothetical protein
LARGAISSVSKTNEISEALALPGSAISPSGNLLTVNRAQNYFNIPLVSGPPAYTAARIESEPSAKRTHTWNTEPNEANTSVAQSANDDDTPSDDVTPNATGKTYAEYFLRGVRVDLPRELSQDVFADISVRSANADEIMYRDITAKWELLTPEQMAGSEYDIRHWYNFTDRFLSEVYVGTTKHGMPVFSAFSIGEAVHEQAPSGTDFHTVISLQDKISTIAYWRDFTGKKITLCSSVPEDTSNYGDRFFDSSKYMYSRPGYYGPGPAGLIPIVPSVLRRLGGPYSMIDKGVSLPGYWFDSDRVRIRKAPTFNEEAWTIASPPALIYAGGDPAPPAHLALHDISDTIAGAACFDLDVVVSQYPLYKNSCYVGGVAAAVLGPCSKLFGEVPSNGTVGRIVKQYGRFDSAGYGPFKVVAPSYALVGWEGWYSGNLYFPPGTVFNVYSEVSQYLLNVNGANQFQNPNVYLYTVTGGLGTLFKATSRLQFNAGTAFPAFISDDDVSAQSQQISKARPLGAHKAVVFPLGWSGYIVPLYGDFTGFSIASGKTSDTSSGEITSDGAVRFYYGSSPEYTVDVIELSDGVKTQRFPVYRAPEKMLSFPTMQLDPYADFTRYDSACRTVTPTVSNRVVSVGLPQGHKVFISRISRTTEQVLAFDADGKITTNDHALRLNKSLVSSDAQEIYGNTIPDRYTGTVYVQVVDTYYNEMQQITVSL